MDDDRRVPPALDDDERQAEIERLLADDPDAGFSVVEHRRGSRRDETTHVRCPYCFESVEIWLDPASEGELVRDCEVCCNPWRLLVRTGADGPVVDVERLQ